MKKKSMATKVFDLFLKNVDEWVSLKQLRNATKESESPRPREYIIYLLRKEGIKIKNDRWFYMLCSKKNGKSGS